jgi:hypothetical protein
MWIMQILFTIVALLTSSYAAEVPLDIQQASAQFPHMIQVKETGIVLCREQLFGGEKDGILFQPNHLSQYTVRFKKPETIQELNESYEVLKRDNSLECVKRGKKVTMDSGLCWISGKLCDYSLLDQFPQPLNYVMDANMDLWVGNEIHSHLIGGVYGICMGEIVFNPIGKIEYINFKSGHHFPSINQFITALKVLNHQHVLSEYFQAAGFSETDILVDAQLRENLHQSNPFQEFSTAQKPSFSITDEDFPSLPKVDENHKSLYLQALEIASYHSHIIHLKSMIHMMPGVQKSIDDTMANIPHPRIYQEVTDLLQLNQLTANLISVKRQILDACEWYPNNNLTGILASNEELAGAMKGLSINNKEEELEFVATLMKFIHKKQLEIRTNIISVQSVKQES